MVFVIDEVLEGRKHLVKEVIAIDDSHVAIDSTKLSIALCISTSESVLQGDLSNVIKFAAYVKDLSFVAIAENAAGGILVSKSLSDSPKHRVNTSKVKKCTITTEDVLNVKD